MNELTTSVVMTTYNGEKYIRDQLDSLFQQTQKIDEVLIFDDGSTDQTIPIIETYIMSHELKDWKIIINTTNKGWKRNFYEGLLAAKGDLIFPCDQDDIWMNYKIEHMSKCFEVNRNIDVLVGKYEKYFLDGTSNNLSLDWKGLGLLADSFENIFYKNSNDRNIIEQRLFNKSFLQLEPGCCFAVRRDFLEEIKGYWFPELGHDAFFTFFSEVKDTYYRLNETVILWRHYAGSTSRPKRRSKQIRIDEINRNEDVLQMMCHFIEQEPTLAEKDKKIKIISSALIWNKKRRNFVVEKKIIDGLGLVFYAKYYERYRAIITDWLYAFMEGEK